MPAERAILVIVQLDPHFTKGTPFWPLEDEAQELQELARSAGCQMVGQVTAKRHRPVAGTFLGSGKLEALAEQALHAQAQVVIFNQELSPGQQRSIEDLLRVKTIDRTQLILDIFAQRARSQEGQVQVELAQLRYLMPRLIGKGIMLSRLGGGIGTRGPGEQKLEVDRRRIRSRITRLSQALEKLGRRRQAMRDRRKETELPVAALVGYTNAGKTTLLNRLTGTESLTRDQLFTTLDPLARRMRLPSGEPMLLTDTVGFLHHLPHHLIEAFKATLEETRDADLLLHMVDLSHPLADEHIRAVGEVLRLLSLQDKPIITVLNKCDRVPDALRVLAFERGYAPAASISAKTGQGLEQLLSLIEGQLGQLLVPPTRLRIPAEQPQLVSLVYQAGKVLSRHELDGAIELIARIPERLKVTLQPYIM